MIDHDHGIVPVHVHGNDHGIDHVIDHVIDHDPAALVPAREVEPQPRE